jgi:hypothetical protein
MTILFLLQNFFIYLRNKYNLTTASAEVAELVVAVGGAWKRS